MKIDWKKYVDKIYCIEFDKKRRTDLNSPSVPSITARIPRRRRAWSYGISCLRRRPGWGTGRRRFSRCRFSRSRKASITIRGIRIMISSSLRWRYRRSGCSRISASSTPRSTSSITSPATTIMKWPIWAAARG